ncbi:MAG: hypothetical protein ACOC8N_03240 [Spirochaetota bacterium]
MKNSHAQAAAMTVLAAVLALTACSKKSLVDVQPARKTSPGEEYVVQRSERKAPRWTSGPEFELDKKKGTTYILVTAEVYGPGDRRAAERLAESELRRKIAEGVKTLVQSQFQDALAAAGGEYTERFRSYVVTVAENVPVVGLVVTGTYWEKIQRVVSKEQVEYVYRVYKRGRMPYDHYTAARDRAWQEVLERRAAESEREQLRALVEEMKAREER